MTNTFLLGTFYSIDSIEKTGDKGIFTQIKLNTAHDIFKGQFEQMPVVPGVCQTQIIKEVLQEIVKKEVSLLKGDNIKFIGMIVPNQYPIINLELTFHEENNLYNVDAKLFFENTIFTKFKGTFILS